MTFIAQGWLREMTYVLIKRIYAQSEIAHRILIRLCQVEKCHFALNNFTLLF